MEVIHSFPRVMNTHKKTKSRRKDYRNSLKVVYISSPMKVTTSATRFRSLVQELTGRHSDVSRFMESNGCQEFNDLRDEGIVPKYVNDDHVSSLSTLRESPSSSDSTLLEPIDRNSFGSQIEEQFAEIFSSDLFLDSSQLDVLGSYEDL